MKSRDEVCAVKVKDAEVVAEIIGRWRAGRQWQERGGVRAKGEVAVAGQSVIKTQKAARGEERGGGAAMKGFEMELRRLEVSL